MKKKLILILILLFFMISKNTAQSAEVQQLLLNIEKLSQLKKILDNMYQGYRIVSKGYGIIKDISRGSFNLHRVFLDGLLQVSPAVKKYEKIPEIIRNQTMLVKEYKWAFKNFNRSALFNAGEIKYLKIVYTNLLSKSLQNLSDLALVLTTGNLRMSEDERLKAIDKIGEEMSDKLNFLRIFNKENSMLTVQRGREKIDVTLSKKQSGL